ncbi:heparinase II/III-like protein [Streptococcus ictaluri 707-05]|uniref:Heparinase II/III-like protein n=2 Tax=Streptococcus ictaluri TaxID=380397 RepID=G5K094_9STRE|nr:heparinase II/III-like protein [Streptococcus ictaluri 707-05]
MHSPLKDFISRFDIDATRTYILKHQNTTYQKEKELADLLLNNTFVYVDNCDMEPCHIPYQLNPILWNQAVTDDPEWNYMLNRQTYLQKLVLVGMVEQNHTYLNKAKHLILDWIRADLPLNPKSLATRTIDTGIRCFSWVKCILFLKALNLLSKEEETLILASLKQQLDFLEMNYLDKYSLSNWGILQTSAILLADVFFGQSIDLKHVSHFAKKELPLQLSLQVLEDSSQFEQSSMYHVEVLKCLLELVALAPSYLPQVKDCLLKMSHYLQAVTGPDHNQIALGDSDVTDTRDILTLAAILLEEASLKADAFETVNLDTLLLLGKSGIDAFNRLNRPEKQSLAHHFRDSGHVCIKDQDFYFFFKNGPIGSSHTHSDQNSLALYYKGKPLIIDTGRYTYKEEKLRYDFKSAQMHSCCYLKTRPPEEIKGSWSYHSYPKSRFCHFKQIDQYYYIEAEYETQFSQTSQNYSQERQVLILEHKIIIIIDYLKSHGQETMVNQFILDDKVSASNNQLEAFSIISKTPMKLEKTLISKTYNQLSHSQKLIKEVTFTNTYQDFTILLPHGSTIKTLTPRQTGSSQDIPAALAWRISGADFDYSVCFLQNDLVVGDKLLLLEDDKIRGKVVLVDHLRNKKMRFKH